MTDLLTYFRHLGLITGMAIYLCLGLGCQAPVPVQPVEQARPGFSVLHFSDRKPVIGDSPDNWCKKGPLEKVAIFPNGNDPSRRYFLMGEGLYRLQITYGNSRIGLMFKKTGTGVEVYTSDQFPECCTGSSFCKLQSGNTLLDYENQRQIGFSFEAVPQADGNIKANIILNRNTAYGVEVRMTNDE